MISKKIREKFGGGRSYALHKLSILARDTIEFSTGKNWLEDPYTFKQTLEATIDVWREYAPEGNPDLPPGAFRWQGNKENLGSAAAMGALSRVKGYGEFADLFAGDRTEAAARIRSDLESTNEGSK